MIERSTVGSLLRCRQAYAQQVCDKHTLRYGIVFTAPDFPTLPEANQFREVTVESREAVVAAVDEGLGWLTVRGIRCRVVAPAIGQATDDLSLALAPHGFVERRESALRLVHWVDLEASPGVRVLPARAMRPALRESFLQDEMISQNLRESAADLFNERLDDSGIDAFVALVDGKPRGRIALHQVGDVAHIVEVSTRRESGGPVARALLHQVLTLAKRLAFKHLLIGWDADDATGREWLTHAGFEVDGELVEFHLADARG